MVLICQSRPCAGDLLAGKTDDKPRIEGPPSWMLSFIQRTQEIRSKDTQLGLCRTTVRAAGAVTAGEMPRTQKRECTYAERNFENLAFC